MGRLAPPAEGGIGATLFLLVAVNTATSYFLRPLEVVLALRTPLYEAHLAAGARKLSVLQMKNGIFTRCVLMDMPRLFDVRYLEGGRAIYPKDLEAW